MISRFSRFVLYHRKQLSWSIAELSRRSKLTCPEISRLETGKRTPTLRHVKGLAEAFSSTSRREARRQLFDKMGLSGVSMDSEMKEAEEGANCLVETFREMGVEGIRVAYNEESAHLFVDDLLFASGVADNPVDAMDALYSRVTEKLFINPVRA